MWGMGGMVSSVLEIHLRVEQIQSVTEMDQPAFL